MFVRTKGASLFALKIGVERVYWTLIIRLRILKSLAILIQYLLHKKLLLQTHCSITVEVIY